MIRVCPSTTPHSLPNACMLSRVRALARFFATTLRSRAAIRGWNIFSTRARSTRAYQTSRLLIPANVRIVSR
jgi:hypothetical protein